MSEFHFLRPWWLAALLLGLVILWHLLGRGAARGNWLAVVDRALQPHVLASPDRFGARHWPLLAAAAVWILATLALAGPTWERLPVPAFRSAEALVVAFDLSRSMDAGDVEPSRLARAKLKLLSLLERRKSGQTALVVFSAHAFTVTPLTTDNRTIASLVNSLSTDIMPSQGSYPEAGLTRARQLLEQTGVTRGDVLLVTDSDASEQTLTVAQELRRTGFTTSVLAVGTRDGAPIPERGAGFLTDSTGQVVIPQLDAASLRRLAAAGGGRFAELTADDADLDALFPATTGLLEGAVDTDEDSDYQADEWRDAGVWLAAALLPLLALGFRRGWIAAWLACLILPLPRAEAFEWRDLWQRRDEQGYEAMQANDPARAAELFDNPEWRATAEYRSADFAASAATLNPIDTAEAHYNRGNALARAGELEPAIAAYEQAIARKPDHADAIYNRDLLKELLKQQQQQQEQQQQQQQEQQQQQNQDQQQSPGDPQDQQNADNQNGEQGNQEPSEQQADEESAASEEQRGEPEQQQAQAEPQDVEQWASDQAAEQWLRRIPQDPGGLLRRKFLYQYQRLGVDQDGNYVWPGDEKHPW
ncbi:MAG TPA: VWA domain-containing protein [Gammaproteobacteria bacterium]